MEKLAHHTHIDMLEACLESGVCKGFIVWGLGDEDSWLETFQALPNADPTMYDDNLQPKPACDAVYDTLLRHVRAHQQLP